MLNMQKNGIKKKYLFNGNIINPTGFQTLELLTTEAILLIEMFNNHNDNWEEKLFDIKYQNTNCLHISVKVLKGIKNVQYG